MNEALEDHEGAMRTTRIQGQGQEDLTKILSHPGRGQSPLIPEHDQLTDQAVAW